MDLNRNVAATMSIGSADDMKDLVKSPKNRNERKKFAASNTLNTSTKMRETTNSPATGKFNKNFPMRSNSTDRKYLITILKNLTFIKYIVSNQAAYYKT